MSEELAAGDIVLVDFEAWTDDGSLFDTTRKEVADKEGWESELELKPMPILLGERRIVPGFEEAILAAEIGKDVEVDVPPAKAFGEHDADQARWLPRQQFEKQEMDIEPGMRIQIGERRATITQITASRVRVDFNHPMAGRTLTYKFKVLEKVDTTEGKVTALIGLDYSVLRADQFDIELDGKTARIVVPEAVAFDSQWFMAKHRLGHDLFDHTDLETVEFVDRVTRKDMEAHGHGHGHAHAHGDEDHEHEHDEGEEE